MAPMAGSKGGVASLIGRIFARATAPDSLLVRVLTFRRSAAGVVITADDALKVSACWACVEYLGRTVGQLPWRVYSGDSANKKLAEKHPVDWLLHRRPNPEMTPMQFRSTMVGWAALYGNAIAEIEWDQRGIPLALWPIDPTRIEPVRDEAGRLKWKVTNSVGENVTVLDHADVFHVPGYGGGVIGKSVVEYAADSIGWARATELFSGAVFGNGAHPSGIIKVKRKLSEDAMEAMREDFSQLYAGPKNVGKVMFLDNDADWKEVGDRSSGAEFIQVRQHQIEEICRWFGVPPHKVMHLLRSTFSNIEHQSIEVVVDSITPWALRFEQEADAKLFGRRSAFYSKMDMNGLLRGDFKSRTDGYRALWNIGVLSINEIRALEDWNGIGEDGDKRFVPLNMTTVDRAGEPRPDEQEVPMEAEEGMRSTEGDDEQTPNQAPSALRAAGGA